MKEINNNDCRALELAREFFTLKTEQRRDLHDLLKMGFDEFPMVPSKDKATRKDRIERLEFALEAWSRGEDVLLAMLADPREETQSDTFARHHAAWAKQSMAQAAKLATTNAIAKLNTAIAQLDKARGEVK